MQGISVFSGSAHPDLAAAVCTYLDIPLYRTEIRRFSNDCIYVQLLESCRESDVYLFQPLAPPVQEHVMELLQMLDAARSSSAARITAVIPYYAYARSDKKDAPRISIAGRLLADLLATAGATRVLTMTLHSPQVHGFFSVPVDHLNALNELAAHFKQRDMSNAIVVSPDLGHAKPADQLARLLKVPLAAGSKRRVSDDKVVVDTIVGDVEGKDAIVIDDEISTAGTIVEILDKLRERGAKSLSVATTHGVLCGPAIDRLRAQRDLVEIVTTDTVPVPHAKRLPNMTVLSMAPLLSEAIRRIHHGESISSMFEP